MSSESSDMIRRVERLYEKYDIHNLGRGATTDALGDVYEELAEEIFMDPELWDDFNSGVQPTTDASRLFYETMVAHDVGCIEIIETPKVKVRESGGSPKTDVHLLVNNRVQIKLSIKHSQSQHVTVGEFDVDTIVSEVGIESQRAISLMEKHQRDASAKNFTEDERRMLAEELTDDAPRIVRWVISGSPNETSRDPRHANHTIMFYVNRDKSYKGYSTKTTNAQAEAILQRNSGFGTGLSWTYATGTKGRKIQWKAPTRL